MANRCFEIVLIACALYSIGDTEARRIRDEANRENLEVYPSIGLEAVITHEDSLTGELVNRDSTALNSATSGASLMQIPSNTGEEMPESQAVKDWDPPTPKKPPGASTAEEPAVPDSDAGTPSQEACVADEPDSSLH